MPLPARQLGFNLEPTFRCNLSCPMCPRPYCLDAHMDMSMEVFERIAAHFQYAHNVDFTGWGEPLLNKNLYRMIAAARSAGCTVTCTSNGTTLNEENARKLLESGLSALAISIDGITDRVYETIRIGADFQKVSANLRNFSKLRNAEFTASGNKATSLGVAFTLQEANWEQLPQLVDWVESVGAEVIHLKHLNVISSEQDLHNSLLKYRLPEAGCEVFRNQAQSLKQVEEWIAEIREKAAQKQISVLMHSECPLTAEMQPRHCLAAPLNAIYWSFDGLASPCCHFGHTVSRFFQGRHEPPRSLVYGDIKRQEFLEIWDSTDYVAFRQGFISEEYPKACHSCYLLYGK